MISLICLAPGSYWSNRTVVAQEVCMAELVIYLHESNKLMRWKSCNFASRIIVSIYQHIFFVIKETRSSESFTDHIREMVYFSYSGPYINIDMVANRSARVCALASCSVRRIGKGSLLVNGANFIMLVSYYLSVIKKLP